MTRAFTMVATAGSPPATTKAVGVCWINLQIKHPTADRTRRTTAAGVMGVETVEAVGTLEAAGRLEEARRAAAGIVAGVVEAGPARQLLRAPRPVRAPRRLQAAPP